MANNENQQNSNSSDSKNQSSDDKTVDVRDVVYKSEYQGDPREIIQNPAVTPQMPTESEEGSEVAFRNRDRNDEAENC